MYGGFLFYKYKVVNGDNCFIGGFIDVFLLDFGK